MPDGSTSSVAKKPAWVRAFLPSITDIVFIGMLAVLVFTPLSVRLLGDAGIGWHIRAGQLMVAEHAIPRVDVFSATMQGKPWFAWEWLYDLVAGWLDSEAGLAAVVWFSAAIIAAVFACAFRLAVRRNADVFVALVLTLLAASASMLHFFARPHILSWLFALTWFWVLDSFEMSGSTLVWILPLVMLIWVNLHGGFLIAFVLLAIYWISAAWQWRSLGEARLDDFLTRLRARNRLRTLSAVAALSLAATLVNPYGWKLHAHVYHYLSNRFLMDHIEEFQSPNFHGVAERCFAALLLITLLGLAVRARQLRLSEKLVVLFAIFTGLYASRNIPVSSLLLALIGAPLLPAPIFFRRVGRNGAAHRTSDRLPPAAHHDSSLDAFLDRMRRIELSLHGHAWAIAALLLTGWTAAHVGHLGPRLTMDAHFSPRRFPVKAVDYLENSSLPKVLLTPDYWGGYLIYRLHPRALVAVDDRHDLYGEQFFKSYLKLVRVEPGWDDLLRRYDIPCVLAPQESALYNILALQSTWHEIYHDDVAAVFVRTAAPGAATAENRNRLINADVNSAPVQTRAH